MLKVNGTPAPVTSPQKALAQSAADQPEEPRPRFTKPRPYPSHFIPLLVMWQLAGRLHGCTLAVTASGRGRDVCQGGWMLAVIQCRMSGVNPGWYTQTAPGPSSRVLLRAYITAVSSSLHPNPLTTSTSSRILVLSHWYSSLYKF